MNTTRKVLIVEDDQIIANIYRSKFEKAGYEVEIASDGQAGFYRIHELRPNAVLLDLMLPQMNGVEILKKIRAQKRFERMPIFVFTNAYLSEFAQEASQAGASHIFNKASSTPQQIIDAMNAALHLPTGPVMSPVSSPPEVAQPAVAPPPPALAPPSSPGSIRATAPVPADPDAAFQAELSKSFSDHAPETLGALRKLLQSIMKTESETARMGQTMELYRKVHSITGSAAIAGFRQVSQMCAALEALLKELHEKPKNVNPSTLRTLAQALDFTGVLFERGAAADPVDPPPTNILVVDDELISRRAIVYALEKANLKSVGVGDPTMAYNLLSENRFDLVITDVEMPGMNGFELCQKLRELPEHKLTPVIFVTVLSDFESRTRSNLSGGNDLIAKPFLFIELAVKALTYVLRARLNMPAA